MMQYLNYKFDDNESFINTFDEAPLWSAMFGIFLLNNLELIENSTVVDMGCGAGFPLFELAGRLGNNSKIYGIDPWKNAMSRAKQKLENYAYTNVELMECSAENIPLENNSIDLIVSNLGINNFDKLEVVFEECRRILKINGKLAMTSNIYGHWKLFYDIFEKTLQELEETKYSQKLIDQQEHRGSMESISKLFTDTGFSIVKIKEENIEMKFVNGSAFLNHHFVKLAWLNSWLDIFPREEHQKIFSALENNLNDHAKKSNGLNLQVPMIYIEGQKI